MQLDSNLASLQKALFVEQKKSSNWSTFVNIGDLALCDMTKENDETKWRGNTPTVGSRGGLRVVGGGRGGGTTPKGFAKHRGIGIYTYPQTWFLVYSLGVHSLQPPNLQRSQKEVFFEPQLLYADKEEESAWSELTNRTLSHDCRSSDVVFAFVCWLSKAKKIVLSNTFFQIVPHKNMTDQPDFSFHISPYIAPHLSRIDTIHIIDKYHYISRNMPSLVARAIFFVAFFFGVPSSFHPLQFIPSKKRFVQ